MEQALAAVRRSGRSADRGEVVHARSSVLVRVAESPQQDERSARGFVEDAQLAPLEWDLACMTFSGDADFGWSDAALAAHGGAYDRELLEACLRARRAQGAAYRQAIERA